MDVTQFTQQLRDEREQLDRQIKLLSSRQRKIDTALAALADLGSVPSDVAVKRPDDRVAEPIVPTEKLAELQSEPRAETRTPRDLGPQVTLQRLLHDRPGEEFDSALAHALLVQEGWSTTSKDPVNVVRTALAALASAGEITRSGRGKYVYDPSAIFKTEEAAPTAPPVVPGTLGFVESEYGSGSYSSGTPMRPLEEPTVN